jgi:hypothetical protein
VLLCGLSTSALLFLSMEVAFGELLLFCRSWPRYLWWKPDIPTLCLALPKTHFSGLSLRLASRILAKVSVRSEMYDSFSCLRLRYHRRKRVCSCRLGLLMLLSSLYKMWGLHCASPPAFSCSSMCQMVL